MGTWFEVKKRWNRKWPSQTKGTVSGVGGEEERLLTVLYYDLMEISKVSVFRVETH